MVGTMSYGIVPAVVAPAVQALADSPQAFKTAFSNLPAGWENTPGATASLDMAVSVFRVNLLRQPEWMGKLNRTDAGRFAKFADLCHTVPSGYRATGHRALEDAICPTAPGRIVLNEPRRLKSADPVNTDRQTRQYTNFFRTEEDAVRALTLKNVQCPPEGSRGALTRDKLFNIYIDPSESSERRNMALKNWFRKTITDGKLLSVGWKSAVDMLNAWIGEGNNELAETEDVVLGNLLAYNGSILTPSFLEALENHLANFDGKMTKEKLLRLYEFYTGFVCRYVQNNPNPAQRSDQSLVNGALLMLDRSLDTSRSIDERRSAFDLGFYGIGKFLPDIGGMMMYHWLMWQATRNDSPVLAYNFAHSYAKPFTGPNSPSTRQQDVLIKTLERKDLTPMQRSNLWGLMKMNLFGSIRAWYARHFGPAADKNFAQRLVP